MKKTCIIYGSTTGTTEDIARRIASRLGIADSDMINAADVTAEKVVPYDVLIIGSSTWGAGDLQDDWYTALDCLKQLDLAGKTVALFGCGDSSSFSDTFCDAIGTLYGDLKSTGCTFCEGLPVDGYTFDSSTAVVDGRFVGLALDEMNEPDRTDERIDAWLPKVKKYVEE